MGRSVVKFDEMLRRRRFLDLVSGATLAACTPAPAATSRIPSNVDVPIIRAVAFDLFTLFDPRGVDLRVAEVIGERPDFATTWKSRLFEYSWLRAASGRYRDFQGLVHDALSFALRLHKLTLSAPALNRLERAFVELEPWQDSRAVLGRLRERRLRLAPLANFSPEMIRTLLTRAELLEDFDDLISTDRARTYKPEPRAYALAETSFGLPRSQIAFAAFGSWDAAGGRSFGFPTFWVNRLAQPEEELGAPGESGPDLAHLLGWIDRIGVAGDAER
jgi:2-haloacid dehalogenase